MAGIKEIYDDLKAVFINCTLKRSPETSNTEALMNISMQIMKKTEWKQT